MITRLINKAKKYRKTLKGAVYLLVGTSALNVLNYFFHLYAGRTLGPEEYGVLFSFLSMLYIVGVPSQTIQMSLTNFIASFAATKSTGKIKFLLLASLKKLSLYGAIGAVVFLLLSPLIANFLKIKETFLFVPFAVLIFSTFLIPVSRAGLQGLQKFKNLGWNYGIEGVVKLIAAVLFIAWGWKVAGVLAALILSTIIPFVLAYPLLRNVLKRKSQEVETKPIYQYSLPVFLTILGVNLLFNLDVLLVKHYFPAEAAGQYAALSLLGKVIFFGCSAVSLMMFPKISELYAKKKSYQEPLKISIKVVFLFGIFVTLLYFLFPKLIIQLLFGSSYLAIAQVLGFFGIFMTLFSLAYLLFLYSLSIKDTSFIPLLYGAIILETLLIFLFHTTFVQVVLSLIATISLLLILLILKKEKEHENFVFNPNV